MPSMYFADSLESFEPVHDDDSERGRSIWLPVAVAKDLDAGFDFDQALLGAQAL